MRHDFRCVAFLANVRRCWAFSRAVNIRSAAYSGPYRPDRAKAVKGPCIPTRACIRHYELVMGSWKGLQAPTVKVRHDADVIDG